MGSLNVSSFLSPTKVYLGVNSHRKLADILTGWKTKQLLFLSDEGVASTEMFSLIENILKENHVRYDVFKDIEPNPSATTVEKAYRQSQTTKPTAILALGGGSTIDVGKAVGIVTANGGRILDYVGRDKFSNPPLPLIALPTTTGTGSEVSFACAITDTDRDLKVTIYSEALNRAKVAILDPLALRSLPRTVAVDSSIDAFVHAFESYLSLKSNLLSDSMDLYAIELIAQHIRPFVSNRGNLESGLKMLCAATLAGMGFSNTGTGNIHCIARFIGAMFHVSHGLSNAVCLPYVAEFNLMANPEKFARVASAMGENIQGLTTLEAGRKAVEAIRKLNKDIGIPERLRDVGVKEEKLPDLARLSFEAGYNQWNPRYTTYEDFLSLLKRAF